MNHDTEEMHELTEAKVLLLRVSIGPAKGQVCVRLEVLSGSIRYAGSFVTGFPRVLQLPKQVDAKAGLIRRFRNLSELCHVEEAGCRQLKASHSIIRLISSQHVAAKILTISRCEQIPARLQHALVILDVGSRPTASRDRSLIS